MALRHYVTSDVVNINNLRIKYNNNNTLYSLM